MSEIDGKRPKYWIEKNNPENGLFRVYWKDIIDNWHGSATLNTTLDTDGFVLTGFYQDNLMSKNAIIDIDIWKEKFITK